MQACHWHPPSVAENVRGQARAIKKKEDANNPPSNLPSNLYLILERKSTLSKKIMEGSCHARSTVILSGLFGATVSPFVVEVMKKRSKTMMLNPGQASSIHDRAVECFFMLKGERVGMCPVIFSLLFSAPKGRRKKREKKEKKKKRKEKKRKRKRKEKEKEKKRKRKEKRLHLSRITTAHAEIRTKKQSSNTSAHFGSWKEVWVRRLLVLFPF